MGNKHSDLAYGQRDPRRYPTSHIGMPPPAFPPPMRQMPPGPRSEIISARLRHGKMAPPGSIIPYGACFNGKTLKKMSKKEKKIFEAGAYAAPPIPHFAPPPPPPSMNGAPRPFPIYRPPPPMIAHRGFGPPRMLAIMPPPPHQLPMQQPQFPMPLPPQPAFYHPRPPMPRPQAAQPLQIEYHKSLTTVNDNGAIVTVEADVARSMEAEIEEVKNPDLQQNIEQKPPRLPEPNRMMENYGNQSTTLQTSSTAKKPVKVVDDLTVLNRTPLLVVSPEAETILKKNAQLLAKAETMQNQQPISCIINDDLKINGDEMKKQDETQQRQEIFEQNDHLPVRRLEFDYLQDVDFAGKLRNVEQVIARKTVLSKDQELKDLDDFDTVFAPKNQISNFGGTIDKNRGDFVEQYRKPVLPGPELHRASRVPIFDPISAWRQIDQSQQNNQVRRNKFASDAIDDYPYDEYCRPVEEKIVVHLVSKPPLKRLDSKKNAASLDDLKNETTTQKTWESMGQNYVNGYGVGRKLKYYGNGLEENDDDRNDFMRMVENHSSKEEFANGDGGVETNSNYFANGDMVNRYADEAGDFDDSIDNLCYSPPRIRRENELSWISDLEARLFEKAESNSITNGLKNFRAETLMRKNVNNNHPNEQRQNFDTNDRDKIATKKQSRPKIIHCLEKMDDANLNPSAAIFENFSPYQNGEKSSFPSENRHFRQQNPKNCHKKEDEPIYIPRPDYDMDYSSYIYGHVIKPKIKSEDDISTTAANRHMTVKGYSDYQQGARINGFQHLQNGEHCAKRNALQKTLIRNSYDDVSARKIANQNDFFEATSRRNGIFSDGSRINDISDECSRRNVISDDGSRRNEIYEDGSRINGISDGHGRRNEAFEDCCQQNGIFDNGGMRNGIFDEDSRGNGIQNGGYLDRQNGDLHNMNNRYVW